MFTYLVLWVQVLSEMLPISSSTQVYLLEHAYELCGYFAVIIPKGFEYLLHLPLLVVLPLFFRRGWWGPCSILGKRLWRHERLQAWSTRQLLKKMGLVIGVVLFSGVLAAGVDKMLDGVALALWLWPLGLVVTAVLLVLGGMVKPLKEVHRDAAKAASQDELGTMNNGMDLGSQSGMTESWKLNPLTLSVLSNKMYRRVRTACQNTYLPLLIVGIVQALAMLPGISRMGITITTALICGMSVRRAFEFSFALQFPLVVAAIVFRGMPWILSAQSAEWLSLPLFAHLLCAGAVSYGVLWWARNQFEQRRAWIFAWYVLMCAGVLLVK